MLSSRMKQWLLLVILILVTFFFRSLSLLVIACWRFPLQFLPLFIFFWFSFALSLHVFLPFDSRVWFLFCLVVQFPFAICRMREKEMSSRLLDSTISHCYHVFCCHQKPGLFLVWCDYCFSILFSSLLIVFSLCSDFTLIFVCDGLLDVVFGKKIKIKKNYFTKDSIIIFSRQECMKCCLVFDISA